MYDDDGDDDDGVSESIPGIRNPLHHYELQKSTACLIARLDQGMHCPAPKRRVKRAAVLSEPINASGSLGGVSLKLKYAVRKTLGINVAGTWIFGREITSCTVLYCRELYSVTSL